MKRTYTILIDGDSQAGICNTAITAELEIDDDTQEELTNYLDTEMKKILKKWYQNEGKCQVLDEQELEQIQRSLCDE